MYSKLIYLNFLTLIYFPICLGKESTIKESRNDCRQPLYNIDVPSIQEFSDLLHKFLNKGMKAAQNFDPYSQNHLDLNYQGYGIESEGYLNDLLVSGLSSIKLHHVSVDDDESVQLSMNLTINHFQLLSSYSINFNFLTMLPIYGNGDLGTALSGVNFSLQSTFKQLMDKRMQTTDFQINYRLDDFKVDISSIFNNTNMGSYLSPLLSKVLLETLNNFQPLKTYSSIGLMAALNSVLCDKQITFDEVVEFMNGFVQ